MNPLGTGDPLRLGPYRLTGVLGAGGMGQVYLGRDAAGRTAAVKVLRPELAHDPEMARRFLREAYAAQAVRSGGVARVLAAQTEGGRPWMATEFLVGPTLDQAVERYGALGEPAVRALGAALVTTLREIHGAGLVHRDLKPSNIVLTSRGPKIIDFGIARPEHGLTLTTTGQTLATPGYAAPEQVLGRRTGPAGDVFSLGVVLAYAAGGRPVYEGGHVAAMQYQVVHGEPELGAVPEEIRALVAPCLAKEAAARPALDTIAGQLAPPRGAGRVWRTGPLAADIARRETDARRMATMPGDEESRPTRRRLLTTLAVGGTVLAAGGGTGAWWLLRDDEDAADGTRPWDAKPLAKYDEGTAPSPLWGPVDIGPLRLADKAVPAPLPVHDLVVVPSAGGRLRAYGVRDGKPRWTSKATGLTGRALAVPGDTEDTDGTVLATDAHGAVWALRAADGKQRWKADRADARALLAADEQTVYLTTRDGRIRAVSLTSRAALWTAPGPGGRDTPAAVVAGGRLVVHAADGKVTGYDTADGRPVWRRDQHGSDPVAPAVADGTVFLGGRTLAALSLADGDEKWARTATGELGWSAPAVRDGVVHAVDATDLTARRASDGSDTWTVPFASEQHPLTPPVVQGNSVWAMIDDFGQRGIVAVDARRGSVAWPYAQGGAGGWRLAGAGNRVFLLHNEKLTAMPVF
ncbi:serine/threonine-protein kinase [Streptomyces sp. NPDC007983]|uniref:serine/threonine-protein kinase n=1 Tax=Streptomyces sp. NPDC007983 TaxID=3364800 RepID=UPI0036E33269